MRRRGPFLNDISTGASDRERHGLRRTSARIVHVWIAEINAALAELKPTPQEHEDIMAEGSRISRRLKRRLKADEPAR